MSEDLRRQLKRNRETAVTVGKFTFTARRPTDVEAINLNKRESALSEIAADFVVDWKGVVEDDIVGGGGTVAVPFDAELWKDWCADRPDFWGPIANAVLDSYTQHRRRQESLKGN